jgi:hypothetical protein
LLLYSNNPAHGNGNVFLLDTAMVLVDLAGLPHRIPSNNVNARKIYGELGYAEQGIDGLLEATVGQPSSGEG